MRVGYVMLTFLVCAALAFVLLSLLWFGQRRLMYFPSANVPPPATVGLPTAETIAFTTEEGLSLHGWFIARTQGGAAPATVIVFQGNGGNRAMRAPLAAALARAGFATLLFDYR